MKFWQFIFSKSRKLQAIGFFGGSVCYQCHPYKIPVRKLFEGQRKNAVSKFFKMTIIWPRTPSFWPGQSSLSLPILVSWQQTMACWNRDTRGRFFCLWPSSRGHLQKNMHLGQTDSMTVVILQLLLCLLLSLDGALPSPGCSVLAQFNFENQFNVLVCWLHLLESRPDD